ncbi:MAG: hypothetical protein ABIZ49_04995, partial [Opitutaceae bacterium]
MPLLDSIASSPPAPASTPDSPVVYCHLDIVDRHADREALSRVMGWIVAAPGYEVIALGVRTAPSTVLRCNFPFYRGDHREVIAAAGRDALTGFNLLLPARLAFSPEKLEFVALIARDDANDAEHAPEPYAFSLDLATGISRRLDLDARDVLPTSPTFTELAPEEVGPLLEQSLFDEVASRRHVWLRLDLINKCNLRCVMC